jgi:hypothetical protein
MSFKALSDCQTDSVVQIIIHRNKQLHQHQHQDQEVNGVLLVYLLTVHVTALHQH